MENTRPLPKESRTWSTRGMGSWLRLLILLNFLVVDRDPNAFRLLRDDHQRARVRRGRVLDQACRQVLVQSGVDFLGQNWVDPMGPGSDGRATFRNRNLERYQGTRTKIRLGLGKNVSKIAQSITQLFNGGRGPACAVKAESNRAQM